MSIDATVMVFARLTTGADWDLMVATRADTSSDWTSVMPLDDLNTNDADTHGHLLGDFLTIYTCSQRLDGATYQIFRSTRPDLLAAWGRPVHLPQPVGPEHQCNPWVSEAEDVMVFLDDSNGDDGDLYIAFGQGGQFEEGTPVSINSTNTDSDPWVVLGPSPGEGTLFFSRTLGNDQDLYQASITIQ